MNDFAFFCIKFIVYRRNRFQPERGRKTINRLLIFFSYQI